MAAGLCITTPGCGWLNPPAALGGQRSPPQADSPSRSLDDGLAVAGRDTVLATDGAGSPPLTNVSRLAR